MNFFEGLAVGAIWTAKAKERSKPMRESAYYFVRWQHNSEWTMGYWNGSGWYVMGDDSTYQDASFTAFKKLPVQNESEV